MKSSQRRSVIAALSMDGGPMFSTIPPAGASAAQAPTAAVAHGRKDGRRVDRRAAAEACVRAGQIVVGAPDRIKLRTFM
jgi:hypothetical protein